MRCALRADTAVRSFNSIYRVAVLFGRLTVRNVARQGRRSLLALAAIVLGVTGLILAGGFVEDIFIQLGEGTIHSQLGHLQIHRKGYLAKGMQRPLEYLIADAQRVVGIVKGSSEVSEAMSRLDFSGLINDGRHDAAALIEGVEPSKEALVATLHHFLEGRGLRDDDDFGISLGEGLAKSLRLHAGQSVNVVVSTAAGSLNTLEFRVVGIFRTYSKEFDERGARINLRDAHELLQTTGVNSIVVLLHKTSDTASEASVLRSSLGSGELDVKTWYELSDFYSKTVELFKRQFGFLELVILLLIVLSVLNTINLNMFERRGEFGTMRALGTGDKRIFAMIVIEGVWLGIVGSVVGMAIGIVAAMALSAVGIPMPPPPNAELGYIAQIRIERTTVLAAGAIGILASALASLLPGWRISRMPIVDALRQNV
jgi:putative ABC transport system permease protein